MILSTLSDCLSPKHFDGFIYGKTIPVQLALFRDSRFKRLASGLIYSGTLIIQSPMDQTVLFE